MNCTYCRSLNDQFVEYCVFCKAPLNKQRPRLREFIHLDQVELPFNELSLFHTYDLLILLRLVREERSKCYKLMKDLQRGSELIEIDKGLLSFAEEDYSSYTARMKVIEGILIDRMGYKPKRVDNKLLASLKEKLENN